MPLSGSVSPTIHSSVKLPAHAPATAASAPCTACPGLPQAAAPHAPREHAGPDGYASTPTTSAWCARRRASPSP